MDTAGGRPDASLTLASRDDAGGSFRVNTLISADTVIFRANRTKSGFGKHAGTTTSCELQVFKKIDFISIPSGCVRNDDDLDGATMTQADRNLNEFHVTLLSS
ncbi:hypothetical protein HN011_007352 [Eciton burchellii]|nr:hypothetical protein HN011_007352 [Eciton burchellii]